VRLSHGYRSPQSPWTWPHGLLYPTSAVGLTVPADPSGRREPARPEEGPSSPWRLSRTQWREAFHNSLREFQRDAVTDSAAALTYYSVLSIFPGLLVLVSILGLLGQANNVEALTQLVPGPSGQLVADAVRQLRGAGSAASVVAAIGVVVAFWSASGYMAAFIRAVNKIYDVPEGRPMWKTIPIRLALTAVVGFLLIAVLFIVVFTGGIAERFGSYIGISSVAITVWSYVKWPVLIILVAVLFAVLYRGAPNVRQGGFRWITPGSALAVLAWIALSALFAVYIGTVASYNRTYGTLSGVIVLLIWLWLSNIAVLAGAELDAELERERAIAAGVHPAQEPFLQPKDTRKIEDEQDDEP
jgi:membrane protein